MHMNISAGMSTNVSINKNKHTIAAIAVTILLGSVFCNFGPRAK